VDGLFPSAEHPGVAGLLILNTAGVVELGELGSALFVHFLLEIATHGAVTLTDLHEDVSLMGFAVQSIVEGLLLMSSVHAIELLVDHFLVVLLQPGLLISLLLLEEDVSLAVGVHVLQ